MHCRQPERHATHTSHLALSPHLALSLQESPRVLLARATRRVQERAADYKASAFTLRDILDELSDELGCDVRAAGLKELVKKVLVHALDALENESQ